MGQYECHCPLDLSGGLPVASHDAYNAPQARHRRRMAGDS